MLWFSGLNFLLPVVSGPGTFRAGAAWREEFSSDDKQGGRCSSQFLLVTFCQEFLTFHNLPLHCVCPVSEIIGIFLYWFVGSRLGNQFLICPKLRECISQF